MKKFFNEIARFSGFFIVLVVIVSAFLFVVPELLDVNEIPKGNYSEIIKSDLIIAGDSRAERQLDPKLMHELTSLNSINISQSAHDLYAVSKILLALDIKRKTIVLSASSWQLNDGAIESDYLKVESFCDLTFKDKVLLYSDNLVTLYVRQFKLFAFRLIYHSSIKTAYDPIRLMNFGYENTTCRTPKVINQAFFEKHPFYSKPSYDGYKKKLLINAIRNLSLLKDCKIIIFNAPVSNDFRSHAREAGVYKFETDYDQVMEEVTSTYPNIKYVSYISDTTLDDQYFYDGQHLCETGAAIFTNMVSKEVNSFSQKGKMLKSLASFRN